MPTSISRCVCHLSFFLFRHPLETFTFSESKPYRTRTPTHRLLRIVHPSHPLYRPLPAIHVHPLLLGCQPLHMEHSIQMEAMPAFHLMMLYWERSSISTIDITAMR